MSPTRKVVLYKIEICQISQKRKNTTPLTPPSQIKNIYSPLQNIDDETEQDATIINNTTQSVQVGPETPPIYVYNIKRYQTFHDSLFNQIFDNFKITHTTNLLKLN